MLLLILCSRNEKWTPRQNFGQSLAPRWPHLLLLPSLPLASVPSCCPQMGCALAPKERPATQIQPHREGNCGQIQGAARLPAHWPLYGMFFTLLEAQECPSTLGTSNTMRCREKHGTVPGMQWRRICDSLRVHSSHSASTHPFLFRKHIVVYQTLPTDVTRTDIFICY